jgi:hypothetical protein
MRVDVRGRLPMVTDDIARSDPEWSDEDSWGFTGVDVGVIGVAAVRTNDPPHPPRSSWMAMQDYVELIADRTPMRALPLPLSTGDVPKVVSAITGLRARLSAVLVVGLSAAQGATVQRGVADAGGPLVIAEIDAVTAALAAAVITIAHSRGLRRGRARVVLTDAESVPLLGPTLIACGIGELTYWHHRDAQDYPLSRLMGHNDILVDPNVAAFVPRAWDRTVSIPHDPFEFAALVVPGLLAGLCGRGVSPLDVEHLVAAAHVVALLTPAGQLLPELDEPLLVTTIARHISQTLADRHR